jgi:hypothetical protein
VICSSATELRSNNPEILKQVDKLAEDYPSGFKVLTGLSKEQYFTLLATSAVQMNTSLQDLVSWTLLETTTFGCVPYYPSSNRTFGEAIGFSRYLFYNDIENDIEWQFHSPLENIAQGLIDLVDYSATRQIHSAASQDIHAIFRPSDNEFEWVYKKYNQAQDRILAALGFLPPVPSIASQRKETNDAAFVWDQRFQQWLKTRKS